MRGKFIDCADKTYGRLTVTGRGADDKTGPARWRCRCECGKVVIVPGSRLARGKTQSCGCLRDELAERRIRNVNASGRGYSPLTHGHAVHSHGTGIYRRQLRILAAERETTPPKLIAACVREILAKAKKDEA
ncbi:MAG: hypothetical protein WCA22_18770 [Candidatus Binatus sp.]